MMNFLSRWLVCLWRASQPHCTDGRYDHERNENISSCSDRFAVNLTSTELADRGPVAVWIKQVLNQKSKNHLYNKRRRWQTHDWVLSCDFGWRQKWWIGWSALIGLGTLTQSHFVAPPSKDYCLVGNWYWFLVLEFVLYSLWGVSTCWWKILHGFLLL